MAPKKRRGQNRPAKGGFTVSITAKVTLTVRRQVIVSVLGLMTVSPLLYLYLR